MKAVGGDRGMAVVTKIGIRLPNFALAISRDDEFSPRFIRAAINSPLIQWRG